MPRRKCPPCLSADLREALLGELPAGPLRKQVDGLPVCQELVGKGKRAPSAYNMFISHCMKGKNIKGAGAAAPAMKECAGEWRRKKGAK